MARRLIEDDLNKKKRKPTASISTIQNVARQVKSAPVKRQTMNLQTNRATAKPSVQKQARPRPTERKTFEAPPAQKTEPASNYFTRVDTGRTPEQQKRHDIMVNAVREYEGNPSALYDPAAPQKAVKFAGQSTENIYSGLARNIGNAAFGGGDIRLMGRQDYNANRENERTREAGLPTEWLTEVNVDPNEFRDNALYQTMMSQAKEHENEMTPTTWGNLMQNFGYNLPGGAAAVALAPLGEIGQRAGNLGLMGLASYGAGLEEKLNEGYDEKYARRYGLANALNETLFQESIDPFHAQLGVTPYTLQNVLGEFVQEGAGEAVSPYMDLVLRDYDSLGDFGRAAWDITKDQVLNLDYLRNIFKAAEMGALGAGINSLMTNPVGTYRQAVEDATTLADNVQSAIDQRNANRLFNEIMNTPAGQMAQARAEAVQEAQEQAEVPQVEPIAEQVEQPMANPTQGQMQLDLDGMPAGTDLSGGPQIINEEEGETVDLRNDPLREMARDEAARARMNRLLDEESVINEDEGEAVDLRNDPLRTMLRDQENRDIMDRFIDRGPTVIDEDASESETIINPGSELRERMEKAINTGDMTAAKEVARDAVTEIFNDELADQPQDEATARLRQSIEDDINIRLNDIAPNQTMEKVAKGELNASKTARDTAQIGLDRETNDVEHIVHHKNDFMNSTVSRRNATGSFKEFFDQIMSNPMMDQAAPVGTIYRGNPISTAIARGKQFAENVKNARTGRAEEELYAHMTDLEYAINESTTIEKQIEKEASDKGITLEVLPAPMGKTIVRPYGADGVTLDTDEAKEFVRRLDEQRAMTEALRKERAGIGSVGGTILNYMKEGDAANMTPASQLEVLQLAVDGINNDLQAKLRKKFKKGLLSPITINQEFKNKFLDFDTTQETRSQMVNDFLKSEARKYPHTVVEQIDNFRYGNMLFRTTTWIRNKGGNELGQGMYNAKNVTAYFLERLLENSGRVADYNVDLDNEADQQFVIDSYNAIENKLSNDIAENKNIKDHSDRVKKFRELGYTGSLLTEMANYRGDTYNTKMNADKLGKVAQQLVTNYKNSGVTDFASADPAEFTKQMVEAYNQNEKQLINREDLRHITTEGKMAKGDTALAKELWKEQFSEAAKKNSKTTNIKRKSGLQGAFYDEYNSRPFTIGQTLFNTDSGPVSALLNKRNDITDFMMNEAEFPIIGRFGDQPFQRDRWAKSFTSRLASQGYELAKNDKGQFIIKDHNLRDSQEIIRKYGQEAALEAAESVYRDDNKWADLVNDAREISLTGKILLDAELAFTRTPFNIFRRAIEYSPVGFVKSMNNLRHVKDGSMTASQWIDDTAKGLTGTGLFALGVVLAEAGIITGDRSDEDDEEKKYRNTLGMNDYSLVIPDELGGGTYSLDWAAPSVSAVLCGAQLVQIFNTMVPHKEGETLTDYLKRASGEVPGALWSLAQPILDTTMMQNLLDTMGSIGDADRNTVESIVENYAGQFTGSMGASLRKVWDDTARSTYSDNFYDRLLRQARNKSILVDAGTKLIQKMTTGESHDLEPQLDSKGNEIKNVGGNMAGRFLYNMISPGAYKSDTEDKTDTELLRLYNSKDVGSNSDLLPAQLYKLKLDGQQYKFTPEERTELNKYYLQGMRSAVEKYMSSSLYRQQSDKERADTIQKIQDYYYTKVKEQYFSKVAPGEAKDMVKGINRTADVLSKSLGINLYQAFGLGNVEGVKGHDGQTISNSRAMEARNYLEAIGVNMDDVKKLVDSGKLKYADLGLTEKVASWTPTEFRDNVHDLEDGLYGSERVYTLLGDGAKMGNDQIDHLRSLESDKDEKGETIRNSRAYKAKEYLMEIGVYDDVVKMINEGKLEPGDVYLNKTVMGSAYKYRGNSGSGSSSKKSSGGGSSRKRSSTTDMDKVYQKLYKMAMSGTLDSIGDLASQIGRQAQTNYGPKSQTTNHEALINELEKMVSQQQNKPR